MIVQGSVVRALNFDSFADMAPGAVVTDIGAGGVEFDRDLTAEEIADVWWFFTSRDDADETARRNLAALKAAAVAADLATPAGLAALRAYDVALGDYVLGEAP